MDTAETTLTYDDCAGELRRVITMRRNALRECVKTKGPNHMPAQSVHIALAKLQGALEVIEELRNADGVAARLSRRPRTIKTTL